MPKGQIPPWTEDPLARNARQFREDAFRDQTDPASIAYTGARYFDRPLPAWSLLPGGLFDDTHPLDREELNEQRPSHVDPEEHARLVDKERQAFMDREDEIAWRHANRLERAGRLRNQPAAPEPVYISQATHDRFDFERLFATRPGEDLPTDGPSNDRTDSALQAREQSYRDADNLNWLLESQTPEEAPEAVPGPAGAFRRARQQSPMAQRGMTISGTLSGLAEAVRRDAGMGAVEGPRQAFGGMRDAVQSILDMTDEIGRFASLGGIAFTDEQGNFAPRYIGRQEWNELTKAGEMSDPFGGIQFTNEAGESDFRYLPPAAWGEARAAGLREEIPFSVSPPTTVTGAGIRAVAQFLVRRRG